MVSRVDEADETFLQRRIASGVGWFCIVRYHEEITGKGRRGCTDGHSTRPEIMTSSEPSSTNLSTKQLAFYTRHYAGVRCGSLPRRRKVLNDSTMHGLGPP